MFELNINTLIILDIIFLVTSNISAQRLFWLKIMFFNLSLYVFYQTLIPKPFNSKNNTFSCMLTLFLQEIYFHFQRLVYYPFSAIYLVYLYVVRYHISMYFVLLIFKYFIYIPRTWILFIYQISGKCFEVSLKSDNFQHALNLKAQHFYDKFQKFSINDIKVKIFFYH